MDLSWHEQSALLADSAQRFLRDRYTFEKRRAIVGTDPGYRADHWQQMTELGWTQLCIPGEFSGFGANAQFAAQLLRQFGRHLFVGPIFTSAIAATQIIARTAAQPQAEYLFDELGQGQAIAAPALYEPQSRYDLHPARTTAIQTSSGYQISGEKAAIEYGNCASHLLVSATLQSPRSDAPGLQIFCIPATAEGLTLRSFRSHDGSRVSTLKLSDVCVDASALLASGKHALESLQAAVNFGLAAICAELAGAMEFTLSTTLEYVRARRQFGKKLSDFQTIQHRLVDMLTRCELADSLCQAAAQAVDTLAEPQQSMIVSSAKHEIGKLALANAEEAVHLHGAMGMMDEMPVGHYLKRVFCLSMAYGDCAFHKARFRQLSAVQRSCKPGQI